MIRSAALIILAVLLIAGSVIPGERQERKETDIPFGPGGYLYLKNQNGHITVSAWDKDQVHIIAVKRIRSGSDRDAGALLERITIHIDHEGDQIEIETRGPEQSGGFLDRFFGRTRNNYTVDYEIQVPERIDLNLENANGNIDVQGIEGRVRIETTNGDIEAVEITGLAKCKTTNGSIRAAFVDVPDEDRMSFTTTNGSIRLFLPEDFGGEFDLKTVNGDIDSDFPITVKGKWSQKKFRGRVNAGECGLYCSTVNGSIDIFHSE